MFAMSFPCELKSGLGRFKRLTEEEEIAQSIRLILTTRCGERQMRPEFGSKLDQFAFENVNTTTKNLIRQEVIRALSNWEPRIWDINVNFDYTPEYGALLVNVSYELVSDRQKGEVSVTVSTS